MRLAQKIADRLTSSLGYDQERQQVIAYGLGAALQMLELLLISALFGLVFRCLPECLIVFFGVGLLRRTTGGAHCENYGACILASSLSICVLALFSRYALPLWLNAGWYAALGLAPTFAWACWIAHKRVPQASHNKPINSPEKRTRLKRQCYVTLGVYLLLGILLLTMSRPDGRNISAMCALLCAVLWQCFTLTEWSARLACAFDDIFTGEAKDL